MTGTSPTGMAFPAHRPGSTDRNRAFASLYAILLFLAAVMVAGGMAAPEFLSGSNLRNMLMQFVPLGIVVIGQTFVILVRGLDLSVASVMATAAVAATAFGGVNADAPAVFVTAIGIGAAVGLVNGLLVTKRNVSPFLATLATMIVLQGIRFAWTQGAPSGNVPPIFRTIGTGTFNGVPYNVLFLLAVAAAGAAALHLSGFGRRLYITGGNPLTAHLVGIRAARITLVAYIVSGILIGTQEAARQMILQGGGGKIVNTASIAGKQGYPLFAHYCASKFAVVALTQAAARALAEHRITVNAFAPGVVATELWQQLDREFMEHGLTEKPSQAINEFSQSILLGRPSQPADIIGTTAFLASSASDYITGQTVMIDGGMVLT